MVPESEGTPVKGRRVSGCDRGYEAVTEVTKVSWWQCRTGNVRLSVDRGLQYSMIVDTVNQQVRHVSFVGGLPSCGTHS